MAPFRSLIPILALCVLACTPAPQRVVEQQTSPLIGVPAEPAPSASDVDYLVIVAPKLAEAIAPLVQHRTGQGHRVRVVRAPLQDATAVQSAILAEYERGGGALRFVLLVGDQVPPDEEEDRDVHVPTNYLAKLSYDADASRRRSGREFPSDAPYAEIDGALTLAVGRMPVRSPDVLRGFVRKLIRYETAEVTHPWPRKLVLRAGTADFGAFTDAAIERSALRLLSERVPYDFDLRVTFGKATSSYARRPDRLRESLKDDAAAGALFFAYVGHARRRALQSMSFRNWRYSLGDSRDFAEMVIREGAPVFVSLACDAGAFDMEWGRRSISEEAVLNPDGPIAAFASTRVSHPYPNLLYGEAFIQSFLVERPKTLGEGVVAMKRDMVKRSDMLGELLTHTNSDALKREHVALYNLLGDPATRLRYPERISIAARAEAVPGQALSVTLTSAVAGRALVTVETSRDVVRPTVDVSGLSRTEALAQMEANHVLANDKTVHRDVMELDGQAELALALPKVAGRYVIKAFVMSADGKRFAAGHHHLRIR